MATTQGTTTAASSGNGYGTPSRTHRPSAASPAHVMRSHGLRQIRVGAVWFTIGLLITVVTFAHPIGGFFVAAYGPMIFGAVTVVRGLVTVGRSAKRGTRPAPDRADSAASRG
jgi:hypothetical protein